MLKFGNYIGICHNCPNAKKKDFKTVVCNLDSVDIRVHSKDRKCPESRFDAIELMEYEPEILATKIPNLKSFPHGWETFPNVQAAYRILCKQYIESIPSCPSLSGNGIVIVGGGTYFVSALTVIKMLRYLGCDLPIELWGLEHELPAWQQNLVSQFGVTCIVVPNHELIKAHGWELKTYAAVHSKFERSIHLDADSIPQQNPEFLFDHLESGAIFWPDLPGDPSGFGNDLLPIIWQIVGLFDRREAALESGQFVVDRKKWWRVLNLSHWLCQHGWEYYFKLKIWYGDKECPHVAARLLGMDYKITEYRPKSNAPLLLQRDFEDKPLFAHGTQRKLWNRNEHPATYGVVPLDKLTMALFREGQLLYLKSMPPAFIVGVTIAVDYVDYLEQTITNKSKLDDWIVVTQEGDPAIDFCTKNGITCLISDSVHKNGSHFNLGALRNEGFEFAIEKHYSKLDNLWLLSLDGDCLLPEEGISRSGFEEEDIYGAYRYGAGSEIWDEGVSGFFQLFYAKAFDILGRRYREDKPDAGQTDIWFRDLWRNKRMLPIHLKHLGTTGVDWKGRSMTETVAHGAVGLTKALLGIGKIDQETVDARLAICAECPHMSNGIIKYCKKCSCVLRAKTILESEKCPIGKW